MKFTLTIKDLCASKELDRKAMSAVRGGLDNQAIAGQQGNEQAALVNQRIGDGSMFFSPTNIQADSNVRQDAYNYSDNYNYKAFGRLPDLMPA
jgi:hypothetical protein